jgi:hypothetical protein
MFERAQGLVPQVFFRTGGSFIITVLIIGTVRSPEFSVLVEEMVKIGGDKL